MSDIDLEHFVANIPGNIYAKDLNGVYIFANDRSLKADTLSSETHKGSEMIGKTDADFPWKDQAEELRANDKQVMEAKKDLVFIEKITLSDGSVAFFYSRKSPLFDKGGNLIGIIGNSLNITSLLKAD
jgi:two-component system aerobic respiration control sensor histidine kinase ArcB